MADRSRIGEAMARFDAALARVEAASARSGAGLGAAEAELQSLRGRAAELAHSNREAGRRIDSAIAKIRAALGG